MRHARFSVWRINQRHETAGLIITDVLREAEVWLVDEQLEASAPEGLCFAGLICEPDHFAMSCGVVVPVYRELLEEITLDMLAWRRGDPESVAEDPRFAIAIYRAAIESGILNNVAKSLYAKWVRVTGAVLRQSSVRLERGSPCWANAPHQHAEPGGSAFAFCPTPSPRPPG